MTNHTSEGSKLIFKLNDANMINFLSNIMKLIKINAGNIKRYESRIEKKRK